MIEKLLAGETVEVPRKEYTTFIRYLQDRKIKFTVAATTKTHMKLKKA